MSQSGFTPIQLYRSSTAAAAPLAADLAAGELAINTTDEKLYFENASGVVKLLASSAATGGTFTTIANGLGAVGTPSYTFTGDLNTGMWSPATGNIAVSTGGVERMRIGSSGNVGIGTASPGSFGLLAAVLNATGVTTIAVSNSNATTNDGAKLSSFYGTIEMSSLGHYWNGSTFIGRQYSYGDLTFLLGSTPAEFMRISVAGNVGIGTSAPGYKLDVSATGNISGQFRTSGSINALFLADAGTTAESLYIGTQGNDFRVVTGSNEQMRVTSAGLVGIGTSSPGAKLEILATSAGATVEVLRLNNPGGGANTAAQIKFLAAGANYASIAGGYGAFAPQMTFNLPAGAGNYVWQQASAEKMRLDASGNVGIGTSSPVGRLMVAAADTSNTIGSATASINITNTDAGATGRTSNLNFTVDDGNLTSRRLATISAVYTGFSGGSTAGALAFATQFDGSLSERMRIVEAGNVGIGTTAPTSKLHVEGGSVRSSVSIIVSGAGSMQTAIAGSGLALNSSGANGISIETGATPTERMRITSDGNVGIGTTAPSYKMQINTASGSNQIAYFINDSAASTLAGVAVSINGGGNNTNSFHFVGITQTVALWYLYGNGTTSYTSDIRVKKNVTTTRDGYLDDVCKLRVVKYNWYNDSDDTPRELGFIAQEVEQVFPGLVQDALHPTKDGEIHKVLKGSVLMPIMLKALQEANAKIDALTARVAQLEGK